MTTDRRDKTRFEVRLDASWDGSRGTYNACVIDLSETGCYVDAINETIPGEILHLKIHLPDGKLLELNGEVAHSFTSVGFGLRFVELTAEQSAVLRAVLDDLKATEDTPTSESSS